MKARVIYLGILALALASGACKKKEASLSLLVWEGYADPATVRAFEDSHQCKVMATYMGSSDELVAKLRGGSASNYGKSMIESDIKAFYQQPWVMVASDGGIGAHHPRGAGTFPRVLGLYVREKHWLTLPEAIRKMTSLPAQRLGWKDRGAIREGAFADLVLFDPETVIDRSTFLKPFELPAGIEKVFVNGELAWDAGKPTGARPGRVLPK
jgi:N-acyl-D-amino-acid deacylase